MNEGDDFDYNGLDGEVFDGELAGSPEQGLEEPQTGEVVVACAYGSDYESGGFFTGSWLYPWAVVAYLQHSG